MKKIIDKGLDLLRNNVLVKICEGGENWAVKIGLICLYFVVPVIGIATCIKYSNAIDMLLGAENASVLAGFACVPVCILLGYIADKMLEYVKPSIEQSKTNITNRGFFDVLALLFALIGIGLLITGIVKMFTDTFAMVLAYGVFGAASCFYFSIMLLSPEKLLNVRVQNSATPAQSLISLVGFLIKATYRIIPFAFGLLMVSIVIGGFSMLFSEGNTYYGVAQVSGFASTVSLGALLPLISYLLFLSYYFILDLCIAIFRTADATEKVADAKGAKAK